jgi:hypothetical protein
LLIVVPLCSAGCVTPRAVHYAEFKASPSNATEFTIGKVHSASVLKNGDLSILAELNNPNDPKSGLYMMTMPLPSLLENDDAIGSFGFRTEGSHSGSGLKSYLYPMGKAKKVSGDTIQMEGSSNSPILIEKLNLHPGEAERLPQLLEDLNSDPPGEEKVYVVNYLSDGAAERPEEERGEITRETATIEKSILLVRLPSESSNSCPQTIAIAGAYEDESTNLYYLLVAPAIAVDSFLIALAVAVEVSLGVLGSLH